MVENSGENILDVVNCSRSSDYVLKYSLYTSDNSKNCYSHKQSKYFGLYKDRKVDAIAEIIAMFEINEKNSITVVWNNSDSDEEVKKDLKEKMNKAKKCHFQDDWFGVKVMLLKDFRRGVNFQKNTKGGLYGVKKYFNLNKNVTNIEELFNELHNKSWDKIQ